MIDLQDAPPLTSRPAVILTEREAEAVEWALLQMPSAEEIFAANKIGRRLDVLLTLHSIAERLGGQLAAAGYSRRLPK